MRIIKMMIGACAVATGIIVTILIFTIAGLIL